MLFAVTWRQLEFQHRKRTMPVCDHKSLLRCLDWDENQNQVRVSQFYFLSSVCFVVLFCFPFLVRMVKFAKSCMEKLDLILNDLEISLGSDTMQLGMRVGIHSGSVTAGVLRGDKSRFQLFGDTVNTGTICNFGSVGFVWTGIRLILSHHRQNVLLLTLFYISIELSIGFFNRQHLEWKLME